MNNLKKYHILSITGIFVSIKKVLSFFFRKSTGLVLRAKCLVWLLVLFLKSILFSESHLRFPYFLTIVTIIKNEGPYLKEWLEFHRIIGVEKFYLYDNESTDETYEILKPYIEKRIVDYTYFPGLKRQMPAYRDAVSKHQYDAKWMAFIDVDEFIIPIENKTLPEFLYNIPQTVSQLCVAWKIYGSNGHLTKGPGLVMQRFTHRSFDSGGRLAYKSIINPRQCIWCLSPHKTIALKKTVDENFIDFKVPISKNKIAINHYKLKSKQEFLQRRSYGSAIYGSKRWNKDNLWEEIFELWDSHMNEVHDPMPAKFVEVVLKNVEK